MELLYDCSCKFLSTLNISNESIKYYASIVGHYSIFQLKQIDQNLAHVYLLCFIHYRFQMINDNLIDAFIYKVRNYMEEANKYAKEKNYKQKIKFNKDMEKAGIIWDFYTNPNITDNIDFGEICKKRLKF